MPLTEHTLKAYKTGTHREISPRETLERVRPLLGRMGITRLANVTGLDSIGIPVVMACRPNSRSLAVAQGKGLDLDAAKASAVMESVEGYHAESMTLPLQFASFNELRKRRRVVDVERLPRSVNSSFLPDRPLLWVEGADWIQDEKIWVPYQMVHTRYTPGMRFDLNSFAATSTGLASGNHILEAASHAICEAIERDAAFWFALAAEEERETRRIDLDTVDQPDCVYALQRLERAGVAAAVWDITSRPGLPAFECLIANRDEDPLWPRFPAGGFGCHPVRHIALLRALTEAAQSRLTAISGGRDDMSRREFATTLDKENLEIVRQRACRKGTRPYSVAPTHEHETFEEDIQFELKRLGEEGFDRVVVVDLTQPDIGIPVVRVIVPGLKVQPAEGFGRRPAETLL